MSLGSFASAAPFRAEPNTNTFFPATDFTKMGVPGLNRPAQQLTVSAVTGTSAQSGTVALMSTLGWARQYEPVQNADNPSSFVLDSAGNLVLLGTVQTTAPIPMPGKFAMAISKLTPAGTLLWTNAFGGGGNDTASSGVVITDTDNNVYAAGTYYTNWTGFPGDWAEQMSVIVKYLPDGTALWTNRFRESTLYGTAPFHLGFDAAGNLRVMLTGHLVDTNSFFPLRQYYSLSLLLDPSGKSLGTNYYATNENQLQTDAQGHTVALSYETNAMLVVKRDSDGAGLWTNRFVEGDGARGINLLVEPSGDVIVVGAFAVGQNLTDVIIKYGSDGHALWTNRVSTGRQDFTSYYAIPALDDAGNLFTISQAPRPELGSVVDLIAVKYEGDGTPQWTNTLTLTSPNGSGRFRALPELVTDRFGNCYFAGDFAEISTSSRDIFVHKISPEGESLLKVNYGTPQVYESATQLEVDGNGNIYVLGSLRFASQQALILKYEIGLRYSPPADFTGTDTLTFTVTDDEGNSVNTSQTIHVLPPFRFHATAGATEFTPQGLRLRAEGAFTDKPVVLYASTNLIKWEPISTNSPTAGPLEFLDEVSGNFPKRFYRLMQEP